MSHLALGFSSNRMLREYVESVYIPVTKLFRQRSADGGRLSREIQAWKNELEQYWNDIRIGEVKVSQENGQRHYEVTVDFGRLNPSSVAVELYADPVEDEEPLRIPMVLSRTTIEGYIYQADVTGERPAEHFTPRIVGANPSACIPLEDSHIMWQK